LFVEYSNSNWKYWKQSEEETLYCFKVYAATFKIDRATAHTKIFDLERRLLEIDAMRLKE